MCMRSRLIAVFLVGILFGAVILGGGLFSLQNAGPNVQAQGDETWNVAGDAEGFNIADWGTGRGAQVSLDEWIESVPASCDIQTIAKGMSFVSPYYRCPPS